MEFLSTLIVLAFFGIGSIIWDKFEKKDKEISNLQIKVFDLKNDLEQEKKYTKYLEQEIKALRDDNYELRSKMPKPKTPKTTKTIESNKVESMSERYKRNGIPGDALVEWIDDK